MTEAIFGGFIGSALTVVAARIFDLIQKKVDHKYSLKKSFFERKLCVAEAAISQRSIIASCLRGLSVLFDNMSENLAMYFAFPPDFARDLYLSFSQQITKLANPVLDAANAASLFFDLDESKDSSYAKDMIDIMISINSQNMAMQIMAAQYAKTQDDTERRHIFDAISKILEEMKRNIKDLSVKIEKGFQQTTIIISSIRSEMKKYES